MGKERFEEAKNALKSREKRKRLLPRQQKRMNDAFVAIQLHLTEIFNPEGYYSGSELGGRCEELSKTLGDEPFYIASDKDDIKRAIKYLNGRGLSHLKIAKRIVDAQGIIDLEKRERMIQMASSEMSRLFQKKSQ